MWTSTKVNIFRLPDKMHSIRRDRDDRCPGWTALKLWLNHPMSLVAILATQYVDLVLVADLDPVDSLDGL